MPVAGVKGSDLVRAQGFRLVQDPYSGQEFVAIPAIKPDWALLHVEVADPWGNGVMWGSKYDDVLLAKASSKVIVSCERLAEAGELQARPEATDIPGLLVHSVAEAPRGAWPCSCGRDYPFDAEFFASYLAAAGNKQEFDTFVADILSGKRGPEQ